MLFFNRQNTKEIFQFWNFKHFPLKKSYAIEEKGKINIKNKTRQRSYKNWITKISPVSLSCKTNCLLWFNITHDRAIRKGWASSATRMSSVKNYYENEAKRNELLNRTILGALKEKTTSFNASVCCVKYSFIQRKFPGIVSHFKFTK